MNKYFLLILFKLYFCNISLAFEVQQLKSIIDFSYQEYEENFHMLTMFERVLEKYAQEDFMLAKQVCFKLNYFVAKHEENNSIVKSDLFKRESYILNLENIGFDIVYNNNYYSDEKFAGFIKGKSIKYLNLPIGYVIFLPKKQVKNIIIEIYAGNKKEDIKNNIFKPKDYLNDFEKTFLANNTALIKLNLYDFLENNNYQGRMSADLINKIHQQIDYFFKLIKANPSSINNKLNKFKDKPVFLMGASFGGVMSIYHAINYPGTFTGYISHAGSLYGESAYNHLGYESHLKVVNIANLKKIQDPIFIHHSLDDNRVNVKTALEFYRFSKLAKKEHLVKLFIDDHGGKYNDSNEPDLHGHFYPQDYYLKVFLDQFIDFINSEGKNIDPLLNNWRYEKFKLIAYRFEGLGNYRHKEQERDIKKVLLSEGVRYFNSLDDKKDFDKLWLEKLAPYLWEIKNKEIFIGNYNLISALLFRQELQKLPEEALLNIVKILVDDNIIDDYFIFKVLQDIKEWLKDDLNIDPQNFLSFMSINFIKLMNNKKIFNILLANQNKSALEMANNIKLKGNIRDFLINQKQMSLQIIAKKLKNIN